MYNMTAGKNKKPKQKPNSMNIATYGSLDSNDSVFQTCCYTLAHGMSEGLLRCPLDRAIALPFISRAIAAMWGMCPLRERCSEYRSLRSLGYRNTGKRFNQFTKNIMENFTNSRYFSRFFLKLFDGKFVRIFVTFFMMLFVTLLNRFPPESLSVSVYTSRRNGGVQSHTGMLSKPPTPARVGRL